MTDQEEWLQKHTFYCLDITSRITPQQCESNRNAPQHIALSACRKCKAWKERMKGVDMTISGNVRADTLRALQRSDSLPDAAKALGIVSSALYYRINTDDEIKAVAIERGLFKRGKRSSKKSQLDKKADSPNSTIKESDNLAKPDVNYSENIPDEPNPKKTVSIDPIARTVKVTIEITCDMDKLPGILKLMGE